jgi:hypothetical protein
VIQIGKIGLPFAEAGNLGGSDQKAAPDERHPKILVDAVGSGSFFSILPQANNVFDAVTVTVQGKDGGEGRLARFRNEDVDGHQAHAAQGLEQDLLAQVITTVDLFDHLRCQRALR